MASRKQLIAGWIISGLIGLLLLGPSAMGKFLEWEGKQKSLEQMGFTIDMMYKIGILEVIIAVLYLIPRTSFLGAILLTAYLGGATVTHLRINEPFLAPVIIGVVAWIGCALRQPRIFSLLIGNSTSTESASKDS